MLDLFDWMAETTKYRSGIDDIFSIFLNVDQIKAQLPFPRRFNFRLRFMRNYLSGQLTKRPVYSENILPTRVNCDSPTSCHFFSSIRILNSLELLLCQTLSTQPVHFSLAPPNHFSIPLNPVSCRVIANAQTIAQRREKENF